MSRTAEPTILFDLGGVLIDWDPRHLYRKLFDDPDAMEDFLRDVCSPAWNLEQDRGRSFDDAVELLVDQHPEKRALIEAYRDRWIEMIGGEIESVVGLLERLDQRGHHLVAVTNWSHETFPLVRDTPEYRFLQRFQRIFVSGEMGLIKPDPGFFQHVLSSLGQHPRQCWFIDDSLANVESARALGLHAHHFRDALALEHWLHAHGLLH